MESVEGQDSVPCGGGGDGGEGKRGQEWVIQDTQDKDTDSSKNINKIINSNKRCILDDDDSSSSSSRYIKRVKEDIDYSHQIEDENKVMEDTIKQDPNLIQIIASKSEINRRIAAFQQCRREELDMLNIQEFCGLSEGVTCQDSCARTSAVVLRSKGSSSHVKLTHVVNEWGPQTVGMDPGSVPSANQRPKKTLKQGIENTTTEDKVICKQESVEHSAGEVSHLVGVEERLHNLESHLSLVPKTPAVPRDVYARLKALEDRVLHLEGISPEYFIINKEISSRKTRNRKEIKAVEDDIGLDELDVKIHEVKVKLKQRQIKQDLL